MTHLYERWLTIKEVLVTKLPWRILIIVVSPLVLFGWWSFTPGGLLGKADAVGYAVCHRIDVRSFHLGERQIGVCARCTGQYLGAMLGLVYFFMKRPKRIGKPNGVVIGIFLAFAIAYAVDGLNSYLHLLPRLSRLYLYEPSNPLRLITGTGLGLGISVMLYPAFNETLWAKRDPRPVITGFRDLIILLIGAGVVDILVLSENILVLYPLALISSGGILFLLTLVYTMVVVMFFKAENKYDNIRQLFYPLITGFLIALIQITILDFVRYMITGSWGGFHLG